MKASVNILEELKEISPLLASIPKVNVFSVPLGYFDAISDKIIEKANHTVIHSIPKNNFSVPTDYFEKLPAIILKSVRDDKKSSEEIVNLPSILSTFREENLFTVPPDYFADLPGEILSKIKPAAGKVIQLRRRRRSYVWQFARAAVMTGIMAVSALIVYNNQSTFENVQPGLDTYKEASQYKNEEQINAGISKLSDEDIIKYLETNVTPADNETLSTVIDETEVPDQKDNINNQKELDKLQESAPVSKPDNSGGK